MNPAVMFVSHKLSPSKKSFQKPNILRRKPKTPIIRASTCKANVAPPAATPPAHQLPELASKHAEEVVGPQATQTVTLGVGETHNIHFTTIENVAAVLDVKTAAEESLLVDDSALGAEQEQEVVDVEAFLNGQYKQYKAKYEVHTKMENNSLQKWHIEFENATDRILMEPGSGPAPAPAQPAAPDTCQAPPALYKCPEPTCEKAFASEQKLRRHGGVHAARAEPGVPGVPGARPERRAAPAACPARACGRLFAARDLLAGHLRDDHTPDDAPHRCGECGRRFFWAVGLRAHLRAHVPRGALHACGWPGCARVFRQPCRLREHARAHTGDRPYRCTHPGCAWAFRTASKLLRHARKHTGERRHRCACGRAFRRREHLRDHQARHRPSRSRAPKCGTTTEESAGEGAAPAAPEDAADDAFTVRLEVEAEAGAGAGAGAAGRAARTHCTWPLAHHAADTIVEERACAVRSDLFLAAAGGEDSQQLMGGVVAGAGAEAGSEAGAEAGAEAALEAASPLPPLGLLDLMQEELLYTDAVDESSFQVLLLEELG